MFPYPNPRLRPGFAASALLTQDTAAAMVAAITGARPFIQAGQVHILADVGRVRLPVHIHPGGTICLGRRAIVLERLATLVRDLRALEAAHREAQR